MRTLNDQTSMTLQAAQDAWEADKHNYQKAKDYAFRIMAAHLLGQMTTEEANRRLTTAAQAARDGMSPEANALADKLAGLPPEIALAIMEAAMGDEFDGIGRPQGTA